MVNREELSVLVKQRILATLRQPDEPHSCLAYWARELPVHTPAAEYHIHWQVMQYMYHTRILKFVFVAWSYVHTPSSQAWSKS